MIKGKWGTKHHAWWLLPGRTGDGAGAGTRSSSASSSFNMSSGLGAGAGAGILVSGSPPNLILLSCA
eukprot:scaffold3731_cov381-Prasinococcus_capsulatus_cf.AAC.8